MRNRVFTFVGPILLILFSVLFFLFRSEANHKLEGFENTKQGEYVVFDKGRVTGKYSGYNYLYLEGLFSKKVKVIAPIDQFSKGDKVRVTLHLEPSEQTFTALEISRNGEMIYSFEETYAKLVKKKERARYLLLPIAVSGLLTIFWAIKLRQNRTKRNESSEFT